MAFSETLRRLRRERFFSQAELARRSGVHALTITRLESGRTAPSTRTVRGLAEALGIQPGELASPEEVAEADRRERSREYALVDGSHDLHALSLKERDAVGRRMGGEFARRLASGPGRCHEGGVYELE